MKKKSQSKTPKPMPEVKSNYRCLLVRVNEPQSNEDGTISNRIRCLFTESKNYRYLIEVSRSFGIDLILVRVDMATILPLKNLVNELKSPEYHDSGDFSVILDRTPGRTKTSFVEKKNSSRTIHSLLRQAFIDGWQVKIKAQAENYGISESTIRRHIKSLRHEFKKQDMQIKKVKPGLYQLC